MTRSKLNVPLGEVYETLMPIHSHRFRVVDCSDMVTNNVKFVWIDFVKKQVHLSVRVTILPETFDACLALKDFSVEMTQGTNEGIYGLSFMGLRKTSHEFKLDYNNAQPACHEYVWNYDDLTIMIPVKNPMPTPATHNHLFLTPEIAIKNLDKQNSADKKVTAGRKAAKSA